MISNEAYSFCVGDLLQSLIAYSYCHEQIFTIKYCKCKECETRNKPFLYISFCGAELKLGNYHQLISMFVYLKFGNVLGWHFICGGSSQIDFKGV